MAADTPRSSRPWRVVLAPARARRGVLGGLMAVLVVSTVLPLAEPQLIRHFVDLAIAHRPESSLLTTGAIYLTVAVASQAAAIAASYAASRWAWDTSNRLREQVAEHALGLDYAFHGRHTAGEMIERVDGDIIGLTEFLSEFLVQAVGSVLLLAGALVLVWLEDVRLGLAFTALVLAGGAFLVRGQRWAVPLATRHREATAQLFGGVEERLGGAEDIRANGAGAHMVNRFHEEAATVHQNNVRWQLAGGALLAGTNAVFGLGTIALIAVGVVLHDQGAISVGTIVALFQYAQLVRRPIDQIVSQAKQLQQAAASTTRVAALLAEQPAITDPLDARLLPAGALPVAWRHLTFAYGDDPPVLHDIDLAVEAGRSLGLVGRTGSGKTTLGRLLLRLYDVTDGAVVVGGIDVRQARLAELRSRVRTVSQDVHLFGADVRDNVTLFAGGVPDERLTRALDEVGLGSWLSSLPAGLDTLLGPSGIGLSAGEAQLLALARLFLADPAVVLLDEPTSRLDPATEALIEQATSRLLAGRTSIVIAHRLASLRHVDQVAVLDGGRIVEFGERAALVADPASRLNRLLGPRPVPG